MKGHENNFFLPHYNHRSWPWHGEKWREIRELKKMHAMRGSKDLYSRILGGGESGVRIRRNCNIFNLAMENVLKGLLDKINCPDIIHIFLITFKLRDRGYDIGFLYT
jgi:hypothetical protein